MDTKKLLELSGASTFKATIDLEFIAFNEEIAKTVAEQYRYLIQETITNYNSSWVEDKSAQCHLAEVKEIPNITKADINWDNNPNERQLNGIVDMVHP